METETKIEVTRGGGLRGTITLKYEIPAYAKGEV